MRSSGSSLLMEEKQSKPECCTESEWQEIRSSADHDALVARAEAAESALGAKTLECEKLKAQLNQK